MCFDFLAFVFLSCVCVFKYLLCFYSCQRNIMALYCLLIKHVAACDTQHSLDMRGEQLGGFVEWSTGSRTEVHKCCHIKRVYSLPLQYVVNFNGSTPSDNLINSRILSTFVDSLLQRERSFQGVVGS